MFVKLRHPETLIGSRCYPADSVVEVSEEQAKGLIDVAAAVPHEGPAREAKRPGDKTPAK